MKISPIPTYQYSSDDMDKIVTYNCTTFDHEKDTKRYIKLYKQPECNCKVYPGGAFTTCAITKNINLKVN